jgi:hypothetical protein
VGVLLVGGLVWGVAALVRGGGDDPDPTVAPTTDDPTTAEPTTEEPTTEEPTTSEPTEDATTDEPTDDTSDGPATPTGEVIDLTGDEPAIVLGRSGDPVVEVRLVSTEMDWSPGSGGMICPEPENGAYMLVEFEYTTLPALADEEEPTFSELGLSVGSESPSGTADTGFLLGAFCGVDGPPQDMEPGGTYSGDVLLDVSDDVTAVTYYNWLDFAGVEPGYRWVLADQ